MGFRRNNFDVTNTVDVTDPAHVMQVLESIHSRLYPNQDISLLRQGMADVVALYRGDHPDYAACDTAYHDLQHVLDVTLASARLLDGHERSHINGGRLGHELFQFGILLALFHDSGYLRRRGSEEHRKGAEFTLTHVSRSVEILKAYFLRIGLGEQAAEAAQLAHYTGYEIPPQQVPAPTPAHRMVANLVATADILAQMSDRCYLEKCHDRLYQEFLLGGIARKHDDDGNEVIVFQSPRDLVIKTPKFYEGAKRRMDEVLEGVYHYAEKHFDGQNPYLEIAEKNVRFAEYILRHDADIGMLQRSPPHTAGSEQVTQEELQRRVYVEDRRKRTSDRRQNASSLYPDFMERRKSKTDRRKACA